jgi:hypothetical protein
MGGIVRKEANDELSFSSAILIRIRWLFVFNSKFLHMKQSHRSASSSRPRFDRPPTPLAKADAPDRTIGGKHPNRSERHAGGYESHGYKLRK